MNTGDSANRQPVDVAVLNPAASTSVPTEYIEPHGPGYCHACEREMYLLESLRSLRS